MDISRCRPTVSHLSGFRSALVIAMSSYGADASRLVLFSANLRNRVPSERSQQTKVERVDHLPNNLVATKRFIGSLSGVHLWRACDHDGQQNQQRAVLKRASEAIKINLRLVQCAIVSRYFGAFDSFGPTSDAHRLCLCVSECARQPQFN